MIKKMWFYMILFMCCFGGIAACGKEEEILIDSRREEEADDNGKVSGEVEKEEKAVQEEAGKICVFVCGAVKNPGVYYLPAGARLHEGIAAAGGFVHGADETWENQAEVLSDGQRVEIHTLEETEILRSQGQEPSPEQEHSGKEGAGDTALVNINTATMEELQMVPGIGEVKAKAIVSYREETGRFASVEQIQEVPGIKGKTYDKIKDYITC